MKDGSVVARAETERPVYLTGFVDGFLLALVISCILRYVGSAMGWR
jgi:hypothetical protein